MFRLNVFLFLGLSFFAHHSEAKRKFILELEGSVSQGSLRASQAEDQSMNVYSGAIYVALGEGSFYLGAMALGGASSVIVGTTTSFLNHQDGLVLARLNLDEKGIYSITGGYGVVSNATYQASSLSAAEFWSGTSVYGKLTIAPLITRKLHFGASLVYYQGAYIEKRTASAASVVAYNKGSVVPMLSLFYDW